MIDEQHRGIVTIINSMHYFIQRGMENEILSDIGTLLDKALTLHCITEEMLMRDTSYPYLEEHILEHRRFKRELEMLKSSDLDPDTLLSFMRVLWLKHIIRDDQQFFDFIVEKRV